MSRAIPADLATYLQGHATEACLITKLGPLPDGTYRYFADLDQSVDYDDGDGVQTYVARTGMQVSAFVSAADLGVDNAELDTLPPVAGYEVEGITSEQVKSGVLDGVPYVTYCIAYRNTALGHFIWSGGNIGEARIRGAALINLEQRSLSNKLKQLIGDVDSTTCRARYLGSTSADGDRNPCDFDMSAEVLTIELSDVHPTDSDLVCFTEDLSEVTGFFAPGKLRALGGDNIGQEREIDSYEYDGITGEATITLKFPFDFPMTALDQMEIERGCSKHWSGHNSCFTFWGTQRTAHFRGEPHIPIGDASGNLISGAGVAGDLGGTGEYVPPASIPDPPPATGGGAGSPGSPTARTIGATVSTPSLTAGEANATANSAAINAAIAGLPAGGGIVRLPAGTYYIDTANPITLDTDNTRIDLATNSTTLQAKYSATVTAPATHRDVIRVDGATEWEIVGGTIIGYLDAWVANGATTVHGVSEWAHGIYVTNSSAGTIKNISIEKCVGDGLSIGRTASDVWVDNYEATNCRRQGISTGGDDITITNFDITYIGTTYGTAPKSGIDVEVDSPETSVTTTIADGRVAYCAGPGLLCVTRTSDITIDNVIVEYNQNHGILLDDSDTGTITDCTIRHNRYYGIRADDDSDGWTISNNYFQNNQTALNGVVTTGTEHTITGESSGTSDHIDVSSDSAVTVLTNTYKP